MSIQILPARLANQIAAGEVVERPASVIKELVENSLDAGATKIQIDIEKGGAKRIRIVDNGSGIVKDELMLALSRHATSKIKNLDDLEAICSLGFRGEALASISSVSRLTLTSKPAAQDTAWQAHAQGREMDVLVQPAAHPNGTTIDVQDLFFNTPARRKFLRTDKTEFSHIEEVIRRIALARFDVTFILTHNAKVVRQYRGTQDKQFFAKRVEQICGKAFIEHAIEVDCQHDHLHLSGWVTSPDFMRNQNDLSYSYVNGRMMKDKLINHAIRQAYGDLLPRDTYPAFVLFLTLDFKEVDVNVHPSKHEVRFHQGRFVHDFIYSVCHKALTETPEDIAIDYTTGEYVGQQALTNDGLGNSSSDYVKPLEPISSPQVNERAPSAAYGQNSQGYSSGKVNRQAANNYQALMTPLADSKLDAIAAEAAIVESLQQNSLNEQGGNHLDSVATLPLPQSQAITNNEWVTPDNQGLNAMFVAPNLMIVSVNEKLKLLSLIKLEQLVNLVVIEARWPQGLISQPLLLPLKIAIDQSQQNFLLEYEAQINQLGIVFSLVQKGFVQIKAFPAVLREIDVNRGFMQLIRQLIEFSPEKVLTDDDFCLAISDVMATKRYTAQHGVDLLRRYQQSIGDKFSSQLDLNSADVDLTSALKQLKIN